MSGTVFLFLFAVAFLNDCKGNVISDKRLCFDAKCSVPISLATGLVKYVRSNKETLSFLPGDVITIFSKSAGTRPDLWGAEVAGKRGYVPKSMVREFKIYHPESKLEYIVPTSSSHDAESEKEGSSETTQDKENKVKISNSPGDVQSNSELYDVIDGTTIFSDPLVIVTPTVSSFDANSKEIRPMPVESTASFIATMGDINMHSSVHSEMSPISSTTMMEKPELTETNVDTSETTFKPENGNVVKSMMSFVSDLVSGRNEGDFVSDSYSEMQGNEKDFTIDKAGSEDLEIASDESSLGNELKGSEINKQESVQESARDMEEKREEDEEEDEDDEDDGDDDEEEEDFIDDEEDGDAGNEEITPERSKAGLADESQSSNLGRGEKTTNIIESEGSGSVIDSVGSKAHDKEGNKDLASSAISVSPEQTQFDSLKETVQDYDHVSAGSSESRSDSNDIKEANIVEDVDTLSINPQSEKQASLPSSEIIFNDNRIVMPVEKESLAFQLSSTDEKVKQTSNIVSSEFKSVEYLNSHDETRMSTVNTMTSRIEFAEKKEYTSSILDKTDLVGTHQQGDHNEGKLGQNELHEQDEGIALEIKSLKNDVEVTISESISSTLSSSLRSEDKASQHNYGDQKSGIDVFGSSPTSSLKVSYSEQAAAAPVSDTFQKPNLRATDLSYPVAIEKATYQENSQEGNLDFKHNENGQIDANQESNEYSETNRVELPGKSNQHKENVGETPNVSDSKDQLLAPQESSGIISMILSQFSSGYGFVADMVLGKNDEDNEPIESKGTSDMTDNKYGESGNIQKEPTKEEDQTSVGGHTFFGSSSNSHCEADPTDTHCKNLSANLPSASEASSDDKDRNSRVDEGSLNWIGFLNFSTGDKYGSLFDIHNSSYGALIYSIVTGVLVLCFFLGHYFIEGKRRDVLLLAKINSLEKGLTVSSKECLILREKLKISERKSSGFDDSSEVINSIKSELEKVQNEKAQLEKELEATTEAGLEMELMISQFLSSQHDSKNLVESIEQLQTQANQQQTKISTLENSLITKTQENENLAKELSLTEQNVQELEEDLQKVSAILNERDAEHCLQYNELKKLSESQRKQYEEDLKNKIVEAEMALTRCKSLESSLTESKDALAVKENEISVLQECLQKLKISNGEDPDKAAVQLKDMLDFGKLKAELIAVAKERDTLKEELQGEEDARKLLEDHVKVIREEVEKLRKCHEAAEREKVEAQTRLEVLSSYFKEKETQLQKELGLQEAMWVQKHTDASTIMQHMKSLEEEVENYRKEQDLSKPHVVESTSIKSSREMVGATPVKQGSQNETLKKEILDQERGYKTQLATFEKKAHENWVAARQAERKLEESKQEASQLRNRLTMVDKNNPNTISQNGDDSKPNTSMMDSNGELSASPLHLGLASNSSVDMLLPEPHTLFLDPNSSPPHVGGGGRLPPPPLPPPPFPPLPLPSRSPYHHPLSPPLPFMPPPPPDAAHYPSSVDGHRPPPLGRMSSPPPPSPSQSPRLPSAEPRPGEYPSPYRDRGGGGRSSSPPPGIYRGMSHDDRGLVDEWGVGRYRTPPPHSTHPPEFPPLLYPHPRPHWEDEPPHLTSSFRPLPSQVDPLREHKGGRPKGIHPNESDMLDRSNKHGGKL